MEDYVMGSKRLTPTIVGKIDQNICCCCCLYHISILTVSMHLGKDVWSQQAMS